MECLLLCHSRSGVGVGVGVDIFRLESETESESLKNRRLRSPAHESSFAAAADRPAEPSGAEHGKVIWPRWGHFSKIETEHILEICLKSSVVSFPKWTVQTFFTSPPPPPIPCAGLLRLPPGFRPPTHAFPGVVIGGDATEVLKSTTPVT